MRICRYLWVFVIFIFCECGEFLSPMHNLLRNKNSPTKCTAEQTLCNGTCTDLKTDVKNCRSCDHICQSHEVCSQGICHKPPPIILASGQNRPRGVVVDANFVYWVNYGDRTINKVKQSGGIVTTLVSEQYMIPLEIAVDDHFIYWVNALDGTIKRADLSGNNLITYVSNQKFPIAIAADKFNIYWCNQGDGAINKLNFKNGNVVTLAHGRFYYFPHTLAVDTTSVYYASYFDGTINKVSIEGGN